MLLAYECPTALYRGCGFLADDVKSYFLHSDLSAVRVLLNIFNPKMLAKLYKW